MLGVAPRLLTVAGEGGTPGILLCWALCLEDPLYCSEILLGDGTQTFKKRMKQRR